jgi:streptogramin lyase
MRRTSAIVLVALALALVAGAPAAAAGRPVGIAESFPTRCGVRGVSVAPGGGAWFSCVKVLPRHHSIHSPGLQAMGGLISPSGQVREFPGNAPKGTEPTVGATAADGSFWFAIRAELNNLLRKPPAAALAHLTSSGAMTVVSLGLPATFQVEELVSSPNGYLWFTTAEGFARKNPALWQIAPGGQVAPTPVALSSGKSAGLAVGTDGNLWFADGVPGLTGALFRLTPTGELTQPADGSPGFAARLPATAETQHVPDTVLGAEGNLWYSIQTGGPAAIGRLTPGGQTTEFNECLTYGQPFFGPEELALGSEGNVWFTSLAERSTPNISDPPSIGVITPAGQITQIYAGVKAEPQTIAAADDGAGGAWFASGGDEVQRIRPPQGPVNTFHIGRLIEVSRKGVGTISIKVPGPGSLSVKQTVFFTGRGKTRHRVALHDAPARFAPTSCGGTEFDLHLFGPALRAFKSKKRTAAVAISATFTPTGGTPYSEEEALVFRRPGRG